jgi:hypothetical protein
MAKRALCLLGTLLGVITIAVCLAALSAPLHEQTVAAAPSLQDDGTWTTYTTAHGLPSNSVWGGVAVDDAGQVWAAFEAPEEGYPWDPHEVLSRFDGATWTNYELPGIRAQALAAGQDLYLSTWWPGAAGGHCLGLWWFDGDTWVNFTWEDGMVGNCVLTVVPESESRVWIASGYYNHVVDESLNLLDHKGTATKVDDEWTIFDLDPAHVPDNVTAIAIDPEGNRWFGMDSGVSVLTADGSAWITYTSDVISYVTDIAFDATGNTWFARGQKVIRFDGQAWIYYDSREVAIEANYEAIMTSFNRNRVNPWLLRPGLWVIEGQAGVWIIKEIGWSGAAFYDGNAWTIYTHENSGLGSDEVRGIAVAQQGNVWIGTGPLYPHEGGVSRFTPAPDFSVSTFSSVFLVEPGDTATTDVFVSLWRGWVPSATLDVAGLPPAASVKFSSNPVTPTAHVLLTITTTLDTPFGTYPLVVRATGADTTRTATVTLHVVPEVYRRYLPLVFKTEGTGYRRYLPVISKNTGSVK